jgi:hypothetical protein
MLRWVIDREMRFQLHFSSLPRSCISLSEPKTCFDVLGARETGQGARQMYSGPKTVKPPPEKESTLLCCVLLPIVNRDWGRH